MPPQKKKRTLAKGCLFGCVGLILLSVITLTISSSIVLGPFRSAIQERETLEASLGDAADFVPEIGVPPTTQQMESILAIRQALYPLCEPTGEFKNYMSELESEHGKGKHVDIRKIVPTAKHVWNYTQSMGKYLQRRNQLLAQQNMSLNEYVYLYALVYESGSQPSTPSALNKRTRELLSSMLRRAAENTQEQSLIDLYDKEANSVLSGQALFADNMPEPFIDVLSPYHQELMSLNCSAAEHLELAIGSDSGFGVQFE